MYRYQLGLHVCACISLIAQIDKCGAYRKRRVMRLLRMLKQNPRNDANSPYAIVIPCTMPRQVINTQKRYAILNNHLNDCLKHTNVKRNMPVELHLQRTAWPWHKAECACVSRYGNVIASSLQVDTHGVFQGACACCSRGVGQYSGVERLIINMARKCTDHERVEMRLKGLCACTP